ncbi:MAG: hypothetical protein ABII79_11285 [bacterium]
MKQKGRQEPMTIPKHVAAAEFGLDHQMNEVGTADPFEQKILAINPDLSPVERATTLRTIIQGLADLDVAYGEAVLSHTVKEHFGLTASELKSYRADLNRYRKDATKRTNGKGDEQTGQKRPAYTARFEGLVDVVEHDGKAAFLVKNDDRLEIQTSVDIDGTSHHPPPARQIPWELPRGKKVVEIYNDESQMRPGEADWATFGEVVSYLKQNSQLPADGHYDLLAAWILHTYCLEQCQYSPVICLFAVPERGKSRTGKGAIYVAYRGIYVESLRDAYMVRVANNFCASLFIDVRDVWRRAEKAGSDDILLLRYEKGAKVPRVLYPEKGPFCDTVYYDIFGPTIVGTNEGVHKILETRAIQMNMPQTAKRFENDITPEIALPLKEKLLAFRARHLGEPFPDIAKPAFGRLGDILKPLQQIIRAVSPEREKSFLELVRDLERERLNEKADSLEARILTVLESLRNQVDKGKLAIKDITDSLNEGKTERNQIRYQTIGRRLSAMGFEKARMGNNMGIVWNEDQIERFRSAYGLKQTHETHETHKTVASQRSLLSSETV